MPTVRVLLRTEDALPWRISNPLIPQGMGGQDRSEVEAPSIVAGVAVQSLDAGTQCLVRDAAREALQEAGRWTSTQCHLRQPASLGQGPGGRTDANVGDCGKVLELLQPHTQLRRLELEAGGEGGVVGVQSEARPGQVRNHAVGR